MSSRRIPVCLRHIDSDCELIIEWRSHRLFSSCQKKKKTHQELEHGFQHSGPSRRRFGFKNLRKSSSHSVRTWVTNAECHRQVCVCVRVCACVCVCACGSAVPLRDKALGVLRRDDIISLGWCLPCLSQDRDALVLRCVPRDRRQHLFWLHNPPHHTCFSKVVYAPTGETQFFTLLRGTRDA